MEQIAIIKDIAQSHKGFGVEIIAGNETLLCLQSRHSKLSLI
jgi:hypothetical protein